MLVLVHAPELLRILMTASSLTARCLSLAVLVLSLAPLASLYVIFVSMMEPSSFILLAQKNGEWQSSFVEAAADTVGLLENDTRMINWTEISNNRTALEELWKAMYEEASKNHGRHPLFDAIRELTPAEFVGSATAISALQQHWSVVIPWMFTFVLGVVVPMILSLWSFWRQYRRRRPHPGGTKRRRKEILKRLEGYTKHLEPQDWCGTKKNEIHKDTRTIANAKDASAASKDTTTTDCETRVTTEKTNNSQSSLSVAQVGTDANSPQWLLPMPGQKSVVTHQQQQQQQSYRTVPGSCVICLNPYQLAEQITWSSNPSCVHCFHTDCIARWITRQIECPCCRREFLLDSIPK